MAKSSSRNTSKMSDREKAALRGPVKRCSEERVSLATQGNAEWRVSDATEYDPQGKILSVSGINPDGSKWIETFTYDSHGRVLKRTWSQPEMPTNETTYTYDQKGRLIGSDGGGPSNESTRFEYDDHGSKTRVVTSNVRPSPDGADIGRSTSASLENDDLSVPAPVGGTVKTQFNERDQPTESQVYNADGQLTMRLVRTYDGEGRPNEVKMIIDNPESMLPVEVREKILAESGASAAELKEQLTRLIGGQQGMVGISFTYDAQGRLTEKRQRTAGSRETLTKITYNDHGDKIEEHTTTTGTLNPREDEPGIDSASSAVAASSMEESEVHYDYQYDTFGNWTEQTTSSRARPNDQFTASSVCHRTIAYY